MKKRIFLTISGVDLAYVDAGLVMYAGKREERLYSPTLKLLNLMMEAV